MSWWCLAGNVRKAGQSSLFRNFSSQCENRVRIIGCMTTHVCQRPHCLQTGREITWQDRVFTPTNLRGLKPHQPTTEWWWALLWSQTQSDEKALWQRERDGEMQHEEKSGQQLLCVRKSERSLCCVEQVQTGFCEGCGYLLKIAELHVLLHCTMTQIFSDHVFPLKISKKPCFL